MQVVEDVLIAAVFVFIALLIMADKREARRAVNPKPVLREQERSMIMLFSLGKSWLAVYADYRHRGGQWVMDRDPERAVRRLLAGDYGRAAPPDFFGD